MKIITANSPGMLLQETVQYFLGDISIENIPAFSSGFNRAMYLSQKDALCSFRHPSSARETSLLGWDLHSLDEIANNESYLSRSLDLMQSLGPFAAAQAIRMQQFVRDGLLEYESKPWGVVNSVRLTDLARRGTYKAMVGYGSL